MKNNSTNIKTGFLLIILWSTHIDGLHHIQSLPSSCFKRSIYDLRIFNHKFKTFTREIVQKLRRSKAPLQSSKQIFLSQFKKTFPAQFTWMQYYLNHHQYSLNQSLISAAKQLSCNENTLLPCFFDTKPTSLDKIAELKTSIRTALEQGADVNTQDEFDFTALMYLSATSYNDITELLLDHRADPNIKNFRGETALMIAAEHGQEQAIDLLMQHGAWISEENRFGHTALFLAAYHGYWDIVREFLNDRFDLVDDRLEIENTFKHYQLEKNTSEPNSIILINYRKFAAILLEYVAQDETIDGLNVYYAKIINTLLYKYKLDNNSDLLGKTIRETIRMIIFEKRLQAIKTCDESKQEKNSR